MHKRGELQDGAKWQEVFVLENSCNRLHDVGLGCLIWDQMAAFITRVLYGENFTYTQFPYFSDVPVTDDFFKYIQKLRDLNITTMSYTYLPGEVVRRDQMAAFIVRAAQIKAGRDPENFTYTATPYFSDVPVTDPYFKYIQKLKDLNITTMSGTYLPTGDVTRDQMAAFLARAFLGMQ